MTARIRREQSADHAAVRIVHDQSFGQPQEGQLVEALRASGACRVSLVAEIDGQVVGHICFSPVTIEPSRGPLSGIGLAPLAVLPEFQRQGIGSELVRQGLDECRQLDQDFAVVLGHPEYYPRFGFVPAATRNFRCEYPVPPEAFLVLELRAGALDNHTGLVKYGPEFAGF